MIRTALEQFPLDALLDALGRGRGVVDVRGVELDLLAYLAVAIHQRLHRPVVLVTAGDTDARRLAADLRFFAGEAVTRVPVVDASPYGELSPDRQAVMELLAAQAALAWGTAGPFTVLGAEVLARRVVPKAVLVDFSYLISPSQPLHREACLRALAAGGYHAVSTVEDAGTFAVRGGIIDVFPPHLGRPVRVELWGDEVESLRYFDPSTQRTTGDAGDLLLIPPVREELLVAPFKDRARRALLDAGAAVGLPSRRLQPLLDDLNNGIPFMGVEGLRPGFYEHLDGFGTYLPAEAVVLVLDPLAVADRLAWQHDRMVAGYASAVAAQIPALPPEAHGLNPAEVAVMLEGRAQVRAYTVQLSEGPEAGALDEAPEAAITFQVPDNRDVALALEQTRGDREPLKPLVEAVRTWADEEQARVVVVCRQETQIERLERLLKGYGVPVRRGDAPPATYLQPPRQGEAGAVLVRGEIAGGFRLLTRGFALLTEDELFGAKTHKRTSRKSSEDPSPFVQSFRELEPGDHVVHVDHGVGRYDGLQKLVVGGTENDFLVIRFAGNDKLFLPVYKIGRLQKYLGGGGEPRIDKLGGTAWTKVHAKARAQAEEDAYVLLDLYARRELTPGYAFSPPDDYYRTFEATFPFNETPDQARAIEEVLADMGRGRPMDRLLCGDVGFGKTEVALRAAFKAVADGKQVAVLVPTTVLALQHAKTFKARFANYPVRVELMSRLVDTARQAEIAKDLKVGRVQVVVGTHRLLSKDLVYNDLGLLILDEEHRFGVRHKERLKEVRADVDVLSMTATPIPRTLQLSLSGIRDLSVITTPPTDRLSVKTFVCRATDQVVRDAVLRELSRGGQVFFVHNRVHSIENRKAWLTALVPEARIVIGHGQMDPKQLETVMLDFTEGRFNVLLSTTIIESGIDIPNANTMLVDHADHYGLAQLYQLRGRVGRAKSRGYCYLLVPGESTLTNDARKRLAVIQKFTELGSGFHVASHDMELRGAGELLGTRQKGHVQAVGLDLYAQLIEDAVRSLRGEKPPVEFDPDINLQVNARLPEDYIEDNHLRLMFYKRLANARDEEDVLAVGEELADRFGPPTPVVENLVEVMRIRTLARQCGLNAVELKGERVHFTVHPETPLPIARIIALVSDPRSGFTAPADYRLEYHFDAQERRDTVPATRFALQRLAELATEPDPVEARAGSGGVKS